MESQRPREANRVTVVEEGTEFRGAVTSSCAVLVRGKVEGELSTPALTVAPGGSVIGKVRVDTLASQGEVGGELVAEHAQLAGTVRDETVIRAKTLDVRLSTEAGMTVTFGSVRLEVGEEPVRP